MKKQNMFLTLAVALVAFSFHSLAHSAALPPSVCKDALSDSTGNPFFAESHLPFGAFPYDKLKFEHFEPALDRAFSAAKSRIRGIRENTEAPTFENTILAIENVSVPTAQVSSIFGQWTSLHASDELSALEEKIAPKQTELSDAINYDPIIFARVKKLYKKRKELGLQPDQLLLLEDTYDGFVEGGAKLSAQDKVEFSELRTQLMVLTQKFRDNLLADTNRITIEVKVADELSGLSTSAIEKAKKLAIEKNKPDVWLFSLKDDVMDAVLKTADNRSLREKIWKASSTRATQGETNNRPIILKILKARKRLAQILGYKDHAEATLTDRMAENVGNVDQFHAELMAGYVPAAQKRLAEVEQFAGHKLEPWDTKYYLEKLKQKVFGFNGEDLKKYLSYESVVKAYMDLSSRLFGIRFVERKDIPVWDPSVTAYALEDSKTQKHLGLFYLDPHPRDSKVGGAWMSDLLPGGAYDLTSRRPHVLNAGNLPAPGGDVPALMGFVDAETIGHELGHALHSLLSQARFMSQFGTNVTWDFVELPSQMLESWMAEPEFVLSFARHYKTGEVLPADIANKLTAWKNFDSAIVYTGVVKKAILDIKWHTEDISALSTDEDVDAFENRILAPYQLGLSKHGASISTAFSHIFSDPQGYSVGYYSYQWADVLSADAFEAFKERGIFSQEVGLRFRREILERGGSAPAQQLYLNFRGRKADPKALFRKYGIAK